MVVGASQNFLFFRQTARVLGNSGALSRFLYGILHYLISIIKLLKTIHKTQFYINHASHLNPLQPGVAFLYSLKTSENLNVF